jgi:hypothetical protein
MSRSADWIAVHVLPAVHAHEAVAQRVGLVDRPDPEQRVGDRDLGLLGNRNELVPGLGVEHAVTGEDHGTLGLRDLRSGELQLAAIRVEVRPEPRQPGDDLVVSRVRS